MHSSLAYTLPNLETMRAVVTVAFCLTCTFVGGNIVPETTKSYENYKVFRVETPTRKTFDTLSAISGLHFWNEGRAGGHADVMVAPAHLAYIQNQFEHFNFKYSIMVENVGDLIKIEKVSQ